MTRNPSMANRSRVRPAFLLVEAAVALTVLGVILALALTLLQMSGDEQRAAQRRLWAVQEAQNVVERLALVPYDRLDGYQAPEAVVDRLRQALPQGELEVRIEEDSGPPAGKRVVVLIRWHDRAGRPVSPVRLVTWIYPAPGVEEAAS